MSNWKDTLGRVTIRDDTPWEIAEIIYEIIDDYWDILSKPSLAKVSSGDELFKVLIDFRSNLFEGKEKVTIDGIPKIIPEAIKTHPDRIEWAIGVLKAKIEDESLKFIMTTAPEEDDHRFVRALYPRIDVSPWIRNSKFIMKVVSPHFKRRLNSTRTELLRFNDGLKEYQHGKIAGITKELHGQINLSLQAVVPNIEILCQLIEKANQELSIVESKKNPRIILRKQV